MKVYLSKPRNHWISPYTILEKVFFWREIDYDEPIIDKLSSALRPLCEGLKWFLDKIHPQIEYVKVDRWDSWNVDMTLAVITLPLLKQLKANKHGSAHIDLEDVPENLRYAETEDYAAQSTFDFYKEGEKLDIDVHTRYNWLLDELIWTFEQLQPDVDWDSQYETGEIDHVWVPHGVDKNGKILTYQLGTGPNHTYKMDWAAREKHQQRINNGLILFGKYFQTLWD